MTTTTETIAALEAEFQTAMSAARAAFWRARMAAEDALAAPGGRHSTYAAALVEAYAAYDAARETLEIARAARTA